MADDFATAVQHHQRGNLAEAGRLYRSVLGRRPDHPDALHLLGLVALQQGDVRQAIQLIEQAVAVHPSEAAYHANLGEAYRCAGQMQRAAACCITALRLNPNHADAANNLGLVRMAQGQPAQAAEQFRAAIRARPDFAMAHNNLGNAVRVLGNRKEALEHFKKAVELAPNLAVARSNYGQLLLEMGHPVEAREHCFKAVELNPRSPQAQNNLGNVLRELGRLVEAKARYNEALRLDPNCAMALGNMGQALQQEGKLDDAIKWYNQALALEPRSARFHAHLASALLEKQDYAGAQEHYQAALTAEPGSFEAHMGMAQLNGEMGRLDQARESLKQALRSRPDSAEAHVRLGVCNQELGDVDAAMASYREALVHDPRHVGAHSQLATHLRDKLPEEDMTVLRQLLDSELREDDRAALSFGLAHVLDAQGKHDEAGQHLETANALDLACRRRRGQNYEPSAHSHFVDKLIEIFNPELFARTSGFGSDSEVPVFILGLPRSGTTLLEQVLASHPKVFGAGELRLARLGFEMLAGGPGPECEAKAFAALPNIDRDTVQRLAATHLQRLQALGGSKARITDKMPDNYLYLGWLALLFPRAKIIHSRRDLRDVAVSCWVTHFQQIPWANDHEHIATRFEQYVRVMAHWRSVLPIEMLEVDYEDTVEDLEGVARRLVAHCGLEWDPGCLAFHKTKRAVRTASVTQVRQPVYKKSLERWKKYSAALGPLFGKLEPLTAHKGAEPPAS